MISFIKFLIFASLMIAGMSIVSGQKVSQHQGHCAPQFTIDNPYQTDVFVKNYGQFDYLVKPENITDLSYKSHELHLKKASYVINSSDQVFFSPNGYTWIMVKEEAKRAQSETREQEREREEDDVKTETYFISMNWEGANLNAQLLAEEESEGYYTYAAEGYKDLKAKGYRKLIYKDLYPGIDVEYIIPKNKGGIKYSLIIQPGADVKKVKMKYEGDVEEIKMDAEGNIVINTPAGKIIDHAPKSFYALKGTSKSSNKGVASSFELKEKTISFKLPAQQQTTDNKQVLIIDPWTIAISLFIPPAGAFSTGKGPYDVDYDQYGNVYIDFYGSGANRPPKISKFSPAGVFLWNIDMAPQLITKYYSDFCVIPSGSVFIAAPLGINNLCKISSAGALLTTVTWPATMNNEGWVVAYNKCLNILLIGGGGTDLNNPICLRMGVDTALAGAFTASNFNSGTTNGNDLARMLIDDNGDMFSYFTTAPLNAPGTGNKIFKSAPPYTTFAYSQLRTMCQFTESSTGPGMSNSNRLNVMDINSTYIYFFDGKNLEVRNKATGALISSIVVSVAYNCGTSGDPPGSTQAYTNEGIAVDDCNNVYVGGQKKVHVFNFNGTTFSVLPTIAVTGNVYDIMLDKQKQLIYVTGMVIGSTPNGFLSSITALPCTAPQLVVTPSVTPCPAGATASVTASGGTAPYTYLWSTGATTNNINTTPGIYTVTVTDGSCGNFQNLTATVTIPVCAVTITATTTKTNVLCLGGNTGTATVTVVGGSPNYTYSWSNGTSSITSNLTSQISNLTSGTYTVTITDGTPSTATAIVTITEPIQLKATTANTPAACGGTNGLASANVTGGIPSYTYLWSGTGSQTGQTATGLGAGSYTVTVTDANACTTTATTLIVNTTPVINLGPDITLCGIPSAVLDAGAGFQTYLWNTSANTQKITVTSPGTYSVVVTDINGCIGVDSIVVKAPPALVSLGNDTSFCNISSLTIKPTGTWSSYTWSTGSTASSISVTIPDTYKVTVTDPNGCTASDDVSVLPSLTGQAKKESSKCLGCGCKESILVTAMGGVSPYTYLWPNGYDERFRNHLCPGTYTIKVTDKNGCTVNVTASVP